MKIISLLVFWILSHSGGMASHLQEDSQPKVLSNSPRQSQDRAVWGISEDQLDELFTLSSNLVCLADTQFLCRINTAWIKSLGWSEQVLLTRPYNDNIHPEDQTPTQKIVDQGTDNSLVHGSENIDKTVPKSSIMINFENRRQAPREF